MTKEDARENQEKQAASEDVISLPKKEYEATLARLKEFEAKKDQLLRSAADFDNAKKRLARERDEFIKFSQENMIRELLPVLDNLERALAHAGDEKGEASRGIATGVQMVFKQLGEILKTQGLKRMKTLGEKFDPHCHEAVGFVESAGKEDEIVEEVEAGYLLHEKLIRAAKVRVGSAKNSALSSAEEKQDEIT